MYEPLRHEQPLYADKQSNSLPVSANVIERLINLPTHMGVDEPGAEGISAGLVSVVNETATQ